MDTNSNQEVLREIRKEFFAFRNGIVADKLRKAGDPHSMIMGCLLVDVVGIAQRARETVRDKGQLAAVASECRLAAPMLYPAEAMNLEQALQWCLTVETVEIADNLCHKLLRHIPDADALFRQLISDEKPLIRYTGYRLLLNLFLLGKIQPSASLKAIVETEAEQAEPQLKSLLKDILEELE